MKLRTQAWNPKNRFSINMTPLIDVIFLLMIFFLMTVNFQRPEGVLENRLPEMSSQDSPDSSRDWEMVRLRIETPEEGNQIRIYLQERVLFSYKDLFYYLNQLPEEIMIIIEPENDVIYKYVIGVYNTCLKSRKKNIVFSFSA